MDLGLENFVYSAQVRAEEPRAAAGNFSSKNICEIQRKILARTQSPLISTQNYFFNPQTFLTNSSPHSAHVHAPTDVIKRIISSRDDSRACESRINLPSAGEHSLIYDTIVPAALQLHSPLSHSLQLFNLHFNYKQVSLLLEVSSSVFSCNKAVVNENAVLFTFSRKTFL